MHQAYWILQETSSNICSLSDTDELDLNPVGGFLLAWPMDTKEMEKREKEKKLGWGVILSQEPVAMTATRWLTLAILLAHT